MRASLRGIGGIAALIVSVAFGSAVLAQSGSKPSGTPKESQPVQSVARAPKVIALNFYADWCPGCQSLKPKLEEVVRATADQSVLFVTLNQTNKDSHQAEYMVASLGFGDMWKEHGGKTGYVLLINADTNKVVDTLKYSHETGAMIDAVKKAAK